MMKQTIRTLIVDDELLARRRISNLLRGKEEFTIVGECANGKAAVAAIRQQAPDLVFLDVQMPDLDGFGVLDALEQTPLPVIVFVTAYDQYAIKAFEFHALDYLLKPFDDERFEKTIEWAKEQLRQKETQQLGERLLALLHDPQSLHQAASAPKPLTRLVIKSAGRVQFVRTCEIDWIEAEGYYARLHVGGKSYLLRETLSNLETQLDPSQFLRIHRSTIIHLERIKELQPISHGEYVVVLNNGTQLRLSRSYRDKLSAILNAEL